ncbi:MAG TPA: allophanate hydrolase, partial [Bryobacteraceae bacterium]|nr:allophanate hydrolase [Bryobacteraceae bacterium]
MNITSLRQQYAAGTKKPSTVVNAIYDSIAEGPLGPIWISIVSRSAALERAAALEAGGSPESLPLYGIPFAVKDNFDVDGLTTTAGCPEFGYHPWDTATVVARLLEAGAILIGKTNMDQFATGLVGTRTPYGACSSVFDENYISGGSSSGSAVAVAKNLVAFSLGTDTAGSGRVPAAFNNLVGLKPSKGLLSTSGVFPACRSLDCVSIFAHSCLDAHTVFSVARGFDPGDPWSRAPRNYQEAVPWSAQAFRFGVPPASQLNFFGDEGAKTLFDAAVHRLEALGGTRVEIDYTPFSAAAELLYSGPWVAERAVALGAFLTEQPDAINSVVRRIISSASDYSAQDCFESLYKLRELCRVAMEEWARMDVLLLPTTGTIYTHEAVAAEPVKLNTNLGFYTNFVNLMDLAAVAAPAGFRSNGLPFGVSFIGPRFTDQALLELADRFHGATCALPTPSLTLPVCPAGHIEIAVVGAHLAGQPLNGQLTERGARLSLATRTAPNYRLYSLDGTVPPKPGLVRDDAFAGQGIEVEVWLMPEDAFGSFIALVPAPLTIGTVKLADGRSVKCFLCEPAGLAGAREITSFG